MVYCHDQDASNEPEVFDVVFIAETRVWVHLQCVVVTVEDGEWGEGRDGER